ncbi:MAG: MFS transporter [Thermomicrobiales bacterium]
MGPSVAGAIIGFAGTGAAFFCRMHWSLRWSYLLTTRFPEMAARNAVTSLGSVFDGSRIVWGRRDLRAIMTLISITILLVFPVVVLSVFARDVLDIGPEGLGVLMASSGGGAVIGSIYVASRKQQPTGRGFVVAAIAYGFIIAAFAFSPNLLVAVVLLVAAGFLGSAYVSSVNAALQSRISDDVRGRVMSIYMLTWGFTPIGSIAIGAIASVLGISTTIAGPRCSGTRYWSPSTCSTNRSGDLRRCQAGERSAQSPFEPAMLNQQRWRESVRLAGRCCRCQAESGQCRNHLLYPVLQRLAHPVQRGRRFQQRRHPRVPIHAKRGLAVAGWPLDEARPRSARTCSASADQRVTRSTAVRLADARHARSPGRLRRNPVPERVVGPKSGRCISNQLAPAALEGEAWADEKVAGGTILESIDCCHTCARRTAWYPSGQLVCRCLGKITSCGLTVARVMPRPPDRT